MEGLLVEDTADGCASPNLLLCCFQGDTDDDDNEDDSMALELLAQLVGVCTTTIAFATC